MHEPAEFPLDEQNEIDQDPHNIENGALFKYCASSVPKRGEQMPNETTVPRQITDGATTIPVTNTDNKNTLLNRDLTAILITTLMSYTAENIYLTEGRITNTSDIRADD